MTLTELVQEYWIYFLIGQYPHGPLGGLSATILLSFLALIISFPLGVALGICRVSPFACIKLPVTVFVYIIRALPLLMVLFWVYYFSPQLTGYALSQFNSVLMVLVIFDSVYIAEIVRAGIEGMPKGQYEAARALGFSYMQTMRWCILPQSLKNMLPSLVNQFISTIKATSLGYIIGLTELSFISTYINNMVFTLQIEIYLILAASYFILCFSLSRFAYFLENRQAPKTSFATGNS